MRSFRVPWINSFSFNDRGFVKLLVASVPYDAVSGSSGITVGENRYFREILYILTVYGVSSWVMSRFRQNVRCDHWNTLGDFLLTLAATIWSLGGLQVRCLRYKSASLSHDCVIAQLSLLTLMRSSSCIAGITSSATNSKAGIKSLILSQDAVGTVRKLPRRRQYRWRRGLQGGINSSASRRKAGAE